MYKMQLLFEPVTYQKLMMTADEDGLMRTLVRL